ncbi:MAG: hypothetical protein ACRCYO_01440, partial [Bacteroidia bacterium]
MKRLFITLFLACIALQSNAQSLGINILDWAVIQGYATPCSATSPDSVNVGVYGFIADANFSAADSVTVFFDFGDGNDTTVTAFAYLQNFYYEFDVTGLYHQYISSGFYTITCIATESRTGTQDTLNILQMVGATCGNVTGRFYQDVNSSCSFGGPDIPAEGFNAWLTYNNQVVSHAVTDAQGNYVLSAIPGYTYKLYAGGLPVDYADTLFPLGCGSQEGMLITPAPSSVQDLVIQNTSMVY